MKKILNKASDKMNVLMIKGMLAKNKAKDILANEKGSLSVEQIILILIVIIVGGLLLAWLSTWIPDIAARVGTKINTTFKI